MPSDPRTKNRHRFSSAIEEAQAQLLEYRDWFEDRGNRQLLQQSLGMKIYRPQLGVVIGTSAEFRTAFDRQKLVSRYPNIEVMTYDDILTHAQRRLALVKSAQREK
jgi:hypothetical protein